MFLSLEKELSAKPASLRIGVVGKVGLAPIAGKEAGALQEAHPMTQLAGGAQRLDPYKNFKLRVRDGIRVHFGGKLTGLLPPPEVVKHRAGGDPSTSVKAPGQSKYDSVTLDRGVTHDQSFSDWASQVWNYGSALGAQVSRKDIELELYNEAGQAVVSYNLTSGSVSEFPVRPPGGMIVHHVHLRGPASFQQQLAAIFESSLRRLRP